MNELKTVGARLVLMSQVTLLAGLHLGPVVVAEQVQQPVRERPAPLVADDLRADDDVAERARHPVGQLVAAVDREREHVGHLVDPEVRRA